MADDGDDYNLSLLQEEEAGREPARTSSKWRLFGGGGGRKSMASQASLPAAKYSKFGDGSGDRDIEMAQFDEAGPHSDAGSVDGEGYISMNIDPHPYNYEQRRTSRFDTDGAQTFPEETDLYLTPSTNHPRRPASEFASLHGSAIASQGRRAKWYRRNPDSTKTIPTSLHMGDMQSAFSEEKLPPPPDVRNWPKSCPVVHLDIANDFTLSGKRQFMRMAFFFYWFLIVTLGENAFTTLISAMTTPVGGNPFVMQVAFFGFTGGYFWFFFAHFYVIYSGLRFKRKKFFLMYFVHTMGIMFLAVYMLLVSLSDIMVLSQPLQPGSPIPIPLDTVLPMALEAASCALWMSVMILTMLLIRSTYFWYTLPEDVERLMEEEEASRPDVREGRLWGAVKSAIKPSDDKSGDVKRPGEGCRCELIVRPDALHVSGSLLLSRNFLHFCADTRIFDYLVTRVVHVQDLESITKSGRSQLTISSKKLTRKIRLRFATPTLCRQAYDECAALWLHNGVWAWDVTAEEDFGAYDFVSDASLVPKMKAHRNRARERKFPSLPPSLIEQADTHVTIPWQLAGHEPSSGALWQDFASHRLSGNDWSRLMGGVTQFTVAPGQTILSSHEDKHIWHIVQGSVELQVNGRGIMTGGENLVIGVAPFLLWTLTRERSYLVASQDEHTPMEAQHHTPTAPNAANAASGVDLDYTGVEDEIVEKPRKSHDEGSGGSVHSDDEAADWAWVVAGDSPVIAYRFSHKWLALALEQNPALRGPLYRYLCHLLADRMEATDDILIEMAEGELLKETQQDQLVRLLDGSPIPVDEADGHSQRTSRQAQFVRMFKLPASEALLHTIPCTAHTHIVDVSTDTRDSRHGRLFLSLHHVAFSADVSVVNRQHHQWCIAFDEVVDIKPMADTSTGFEFVLRSSRRVSVWGIVNTPVVSETMMLFWKDHDVGSSFHPPPIITGTASPTSADADALTRRPPAVSDAQTPLIDLAGGDVGGDDDATPDDSTIFDLGPTVDPGYAPDPTDTLNTSFENVPPGEQPLPPATPTEVAETNLDNLPPPEAPEQPITTAEDRDEVGSNNGEPRITLAASATTTSSDGRLLSGLASALGKKKGYVQLDEEEGVEIGGGMTPATDYAAAYARMSLEDKQTLFQSAPSIGMVRNQIVHSHDTFNRDDPGVYFVEHGMVREQHLVLDDTSRVMLRRMGQGAVFGMHGLLTGLAPRSTVVVDSDRATIKHMSAHQLRVALDMAGPELKGRWYRDIAVDLAVHPSTLMYLVDKWQALPY